MSLHPTQADLDARAAAREAGRRLATRTDTVSTTVDGETASVTTTASAVIPDEGVAFTGLSIGGEPLPDLGVTDFDTPATDAVLGDHDGSEAVTWEQPVREVEPQAGFRAFEKDGPGKLTFTREFVKDPLAVCAFAVERLAAVRAGERASESRAVVQGDVRVIWFTREMAAYSADWTGDRARDAAQQFADALREAGEQAAFVTLDVDNDPETAAEGGSTAEEAAQAMDTPQALAGACGSTEVGDRFRMGAAGPQSIHVDWKTTERGAVMMRAFFDQQGHADAFRDALLQRKDIAKVEATVPHGFKAGDRWDVEPPQELRQLLGQLVGDVIRQRRRSKVRAYAVGVAAKVGEGFALGVGFYIALWVAVAATKALV